MNKFKVVAFALLAMFVFTGCSVKNSSDVIKINDTVITKSEYEKAYDSVVSGKMFEQMGLDLKKDPNNIFALMMKEQVVSSLIVKTLLNEEMDKRKISVSKEEIEAGEKEIISRFGTKEQFEQILKSNGVPYKKFKKDLEDEIRMKKFVDSVAMVSIGESVAKKYYDDNIDKFKYPKRVRASHILISANENQISEKIKEENKDITEEELKTKVQDEMNAKKEKAQKLQAQLKNLPKNFAKLAKENSEDMVSATRGGDLGFFAQEEMVPAFANVAFSIAPNTISDVVKTDFGYHIIMVTDRNEAGTLTFEQSKKDIINYLEGRDKVEILKSKIESLKNEAKIEYLDPSFNPDEIQKKIKAEAEKSPELKALAGLATNQNK